MHLPLSQHAQMRCAHAPNCLLFSQHFHFAKISHAASLFSLLATSQVRLALLTPPVSAPPSTLLHLCTSQHFEARSSSQRATHALATASQTAQLYLDRRKRSHALAMPLVGAAVHFAHCPQHCSACTLFVRRRCTANSSPVRQQQSTQGSGASQHPFNSCRSP